MKTITPRIEKAIDIFLDAINNGTLAKGNCAACAVGNLCAAAIGYTPRLIEDGQPSNKWSALFCTVEDLDTGQVVQYRNVVKNFFDQKPAPQEFIDAGRDLISKTSFSEEELSKIEYVFETNTKIFFRDYSMHSNEEIRADQIKGLEAVVKVMLTFDDCKETAQEVFTKRAELIPV